MPRRGPAVLGLWATTAALATVPGRASSSSSTTAWTVATQREGCTATCAAVYGDSSTCDDAMQGTAGSETETEAAYNAAGFMCNGFATNCNSGNNNVNCQTWGAPYLHTVRVI